MILKKVVKFIKYLFLCLAILFVLLITVVNLPFSQRIITERANLIFQKQDLPVNIGKITLLINGKIGISDIQIISNKADTMVYAKRITASVRIMPVLRKHLIVNNLTIDNAVVNIKADTVTGILNLISVFKTGEKPDKELKEKKGRKWDIGVNSVNLKNVRFSYNDQLRGIHIFESLSKLSAGFESFSVANRKIHAGNLVIENSTGGVDLTKTAKKSQTRTSRKQGASWIFMLSRSDLKDIRFTLNQPDKMNRMEFAIADGDISYAGLSLADQRISFDEVNLHGPDARLYITPSPAGPAQTESATGPDFPGLWKIAGSKITIADGSFHKGDYTGKSDSAGIYQIANLNTTITGIKLDSMKSGLEMSRLSLSLENGFKIEKGKIIFSSDSTGTTNAEVYLNTASSKINVALNAGEKPATILKYYKKVPFSVLIKDSEVSSIDFLTLFPALNRQSEFKKQEDFKIGIDCDISGTADLLKIGRIDLFTAKGVRVSTSGVIKNLLNRSSAALSLSFAAEGITKSLLVELLALRGSSPAVPDFGTAALEGKIDSTLSEPYFAVSVKSSSGNADLAGSLDISEKSYAIRALCSGIQLGILSGVSDLGRFSGKIGLSGKGFSPYTMKLKASVEVDTAFYNGYDYRNIKLNLDADQGTCLFAIYAADPALKSTLTGKLKLSDAQIGGYISGLFSLDAGKVNLYNGLSLRGGLEASLDHSAGVLTGSLSLKDFEMSRDKKTGIIKNGVLSFHSSDTGLSGNIESDFLKGNASYDGSLEDFKTALKEGRVRGSAIADSAIGNRIPYFSSISKLKISVESTYNPLISVFLSDSLFNYNRVSFNFLKDSTGTGQANLLADRFNIGKTSGYGAEMQFENHPGSSFIKISADSINYGKISLEALSTDISIANDTAIYNLKANGRNDSLIYDIKWFAINNDGKIQLKSSQDQWVINGLRWDVNSGDFLVLDRNRNDMAVDLHWKNGDQAIDIYGTKSEKISFECRKLWLSQLLVPGMYSYKYDGEFTGKIDYRAFDGKREINADAAIRQITMDRSMLGDLLISGKLMTDTIGTLEADVNATMNDTSSIKFTIRSDKNSGRQVINSEFTDIRLNTFEPLLSTYISGLQGVVNGNLSFSGDGTRNQLAGRLKINNTALRIVPLNASFFLPEDVIEIENNRLVFNKFTVLDSLKNRLSLDGTINMEDFGNITASLYVSSDHLQIMNTTEKESPGFNGSIFINTGINISGPVKKPSLNGNIVLAGGTVINYRYTENLAVSETEKTVVFTSFKQEQSSVLVKPVVPDQLQRTPNVEATVEIDPGSLFNFQVTRGFDVGVSIRGGGFLTYSMMQNKEIDLSGTYEINQGSSVLKIPGWPRKDFIITPGSFLKWNGKLDDPELNVATTSNVRGSYLNPVDQKTREVNFIVYMKLSGRLSELEILFDVRSEDQYITTVFNTLSADERMRQAINLLIFGSIQLPNLSSSSNYLTQQINQFWESQLNQLTKSAFRKIDVSLGVDSYTEGATSKTYTSLSYQVKKEMFKDRGSVLVSGHMNDNTPTSQQSNAVIENFIFEYALDTNRTKFVKVYRQQNYEDLLEGEVVKSGIGFIYRKSYDRLSDIWRRQKRPKK